MSYLRPDIAAMPGYTPGEQLPTGKYIKLNTNENPYPPSPAVARAINTTLECGLSRYPDPMADAFRMRAAEVLGLDSPEWILCGNGSDDILTIVTRAFVGHGQRIRYPRPSYVLYETLARIQGAQFEEVSFQDDWTLADDFAAPADDLRLAFLPNPNSPSGTVLTPDQVLRIAEQLPCPLLVDEAYVDFAAHSCLELVARNDRILVSRTLSKSYGLAGLRFGFLVAQPAVIDQLQKVKDSYNCDALAISGAVAAIDDQTWLGENRAKVLATRERMTESLRTLGFAVVPSQANFVWCSHPEQSAHDIYVRLKRNRILVRYMDYPGWGDGLRISVGTDGQVDACLGLIQDLVLGAR